MRRALSSGVMMEAAGPSFRFACRSLRESQGRKLPRSRQNPIDHYPVPRLPRPGGDLLFVHPRRDAIKAQPFRPQRLNQSSALRLHPRSTQTASGPRNGLPWRVSAAARPGA